MHIIDVIPTVKIPKTDLQVLSYFSHSPLLEGALVRVPVGHRSINALVVSSQPLEGRKISVKKSGFQMRNITAIISEEPILSERELALLKYCAQYYAAPLHIMLATMLPRYVAQKKTALKLGKKQEPARTLSDASSSQKPTLLVKRDRTLDYENFIQRCLASGRQVLFLVPDIAHGHHGIEVFARYRPVLMSSELTPKQFFSVWDGIRTGTVPFVIGTRSSVFSNFHNLGLIILDDEHSDHYKSWDMMPYYHAKPVTLKLAEFHGARMVLGSAIPSIESFYQASQNTYELAGGYLEPSRTPFTMVDMRNELVDKNYSIFSYQLKRELEQMFETKDKKAVLLITRRGSASFYFCRHCGHIETCPQCEAYLVYHAMAKALLMCHHCGYVKEPSLSCARCKNHTIKPFGAGTQKVAEEIKKTFGYDGALVMDTDMARTYKDRLAIFGQFRSGASRVLIGTTYALLGRPELEGTADIAAIVSLDNILFIPDYTIGEKIFRMTGEFHAIGKPDASFLLQTHMPDNELLVAARTQDYRALYEREIASRAELRYPPFSHMIKFTMRDVNAKTAEHKARELFNALERSLKKADASYELFGPIPAYVPKVKNRYVYHVALKLMRIDARTRSAMLAYCSERASIDVDPLNLIA